MTSTTTSGEKSYVIKLKNETREDWEVFKMLFKVRAQKKGFWWATINAPEDLLPQDQHFIQDDVVMKHNEDTDEWVEATNMEKAACKSDAAARDFLNMCLQEDHPTLLNKVTEQGETAHSWWAYLEEKFETRDPMNRFMELDAEISELQPGNFQDGYKFVAKFEQLESAVSLVSSDNARTDARKKLWLFQKIDVAPKGEGNAWSAFVAKYKADGALTAVDWNAFKLEFSKNWTETAIQVSRPKTRRW